MRIAPISNNNKISFGYFAKPSEEVVQEIQKRLQDAKPEERDEFVSKVESIVEENKNIGIEIKQGIEKMNGRLSYFCEFEENHFVEPNPDDPPLTRIIKTMENVANEAKNVISYQNSVKEYNRIWE